MLETVPYWNFNLSSAAADQKQTKSKNLHTIFFGGDVTICMHPLSPMSLFVSSLVAPFLNDPIPYYIF